MNLYLSERGHQAGTVCDPTEARAGNYWGRALITSDHLRYMLQRYLDATHMAVAPIGSSGYHNRDAGVHGGVHNQVGRRITPSSRPIQRYS